MTLAPDFTCGYDSQIDVSAGTNVTIHGNGAVLDAAKKGQSTSRNNSLSIEIQGPQGHHTHTPIKRGGVVVY